MDQGLFAKYNQVIKQRETTQDDILISIQETTGIALTKEELLLEKKTISFSVSSVKKLALRNKKVEDLLKEKGYSVKF